MLWYVLFVLPRFSNSLWRSVLTSLIVRAASVTTTHCVAGVLWRTSVLGGPSVRMQWSPWDGCRTPVSASQPQSPPASLSWMTLRLWVCLFVCVCLFLTLSLYFYVPYPTVECDSHSRIAPTADEWELPVSVCRQRKTECDHSWCWGGNSQHCIPVQHHWEDPYLHWCTARYDKLDITARAYESLNIPPWSIVVDSSIFYALAVTDFSFVSSEVGIPFATNVGALTVTRCETAVRYAGRLNSTHCAHIHVYT